MKANCWEVKKCGRQPGGAHVAQLGVCPAATDTANEGRNGGQHAGRFCWKVSGTLCGGQVQGSFAQKMLNCTQCDFFKSVRLEEGRGFQA